MTKWRTFTLRTWFVSAFLCLILLGTAVMIALVYGIREAMLDREARILVRQLLAHEEAALEHALAPAESTLLIAREWLISGALANLNPEELRSRAAPLLAANPELEAILLKRPMDPPVTVGAENARNLPAVEAWEAPARRLAEARADGNRDNSPDLVWGLTAPAEEGGESLYGALAIAGRGGEGGAAAVAISSGLLQAALAKVRHRPEIWSFWFWNEDAAAETALRPGHALEATEAAGLNHLAELWRTMPPERRGEVLPVRIAGARWWGAIQPYAGRLDIPIHAGVLVPEHVILPAYNELLSSMAVVSFAGFLAALCLALLMARRVRKPLEAATVAVLRLSSGTGSQEYWPRTRLRELWQLLQAVDALQGRLIATAKDSEDAPARRDTLLSLRKWASREEEPALPVPELSETAPAPDAQDATSPASPILLPDHDPPAALIQALETARRQLRTAREELESAYAQLGAAGARDRQHRKHLERSRAAVVGLSRLDGRPMPTAQGRLERFAEMAGGALGASRVSVWEFDESRSQLKQVALWEGMEEDKADLRTFGRQEFKGFFTAIETETLLTIGDTREARELSQLHEAYLAPADIQAIIAVPLVATGRLAGALLFEHAKTPRAWTAEEEALALTIGAMAAPLLGIKAEAPVSEAQVIQPAAPLSSSLDRALERGTAVIWEVDGIGCITLVAGAVTEIYGYAAEELLGKPMSLLADEEQAAADLDRLMSLLDGEPCEPYTCTHRRKDGTLIRVLATAKAIVSEDGSSTGASGTAVLLETMA